MPATEAAAYGSTPSGSMLPAMPKARVPIILLLLLVVASCTPPADESTERWVAFLDRHRVLLEEGRFNEQDFRAEGDPILEQLVKLKNPTDDKLLLSADTLAEFNRAMQAFNEAAAKARSAGDGRPAAAFAEYYERLKPRSQVSANAEAG